MASVELSNLNPAGAVSRLPVLHRLFAVPRLHTRDAILIYFFAIAILVRFWVGTDPDYWWHLKTGETIVKTLSVPTTDPYSFTAAGAPWIDQEWLAQALMYGLAQTVGYGASVLIFGLIGAAAVLIMNRLLHQLDVPEPIILGLTVAGVVLTFGFWVVRPNTLTLLLFAIFLSSAFRFIRGQTRSLWHLPPLMVLWANVHAAYIIGLGVVALLLLVQAWRWKQGEGARLGHVALVATLTFLAVGVNPYTYKLWVYVFNYFLGDNPGLEFISEWQSPRFFHNWVTYPLGFTILGLIVLFAMARKPDLWRISVAVVFTAMAMQATRHQSLFALAMIPVAGELVVSAWPSLPAMRRRIESKLLGMVNFGLVALFIAASGIFVLGWAEQSSRHASTSLGIRYYPAQAAAFVRENFPVARMMNHYDYGGYLIYALDAAPPVFIDGRAEVYGGAIAGDFLTAALLRPGWQDVLNRYQIDLVLFPTDAPLVQALRLDEGWTEAFRGKQESVFVRAPLVPQP